MPRILSGSSTSKGFSASSLTRLNFLSTSPVVFSLASRSESVSTVSIFIRALGITKSASGPYSTANSCTSSSSLKLMRVMTFLNAASSTLERRLRSIRDTDSSSFEREEKPSPMTTVNTNAIRASATRISIKLKPFWLKGVLLIRIQLPKNHLLHWPRLFHGTKCQHLLLLHLQQDRHRKKQY